MITRFTKGVSNLTIADVFPVAWNDNCRRVPGRLKDHFILWLKALSKGHYCMMLHIDPEALRNVPILKDGDLRKTSVHIHPN